MVVYAYIALVLASVARHATSNVTVQAATNIYNIIEHNHQELVQLNAEFQTASTLATQWQQRTRVLEAENARLRSQVCELNEAAAALRQRAKCAPPYFDAF